MTSSPRYSQSNGKSESAVKIAKTILKKTLKEGSDIYTAMLGWRNTSDPDGVSAVQKLMSRRTRTCLPTAEVVPTVPEQIRLRKQKDKLHYDRGAKDLLELKIGQCVLLQPDLPHQHWRRAVCRQILGDRSYMYVVETDDAHQYRRNRRFLRAMANIIPETPSAERMGEDLQPPNSRQHHSRHQQASAEGRGDQPSTADQPTDQREMTAPRLPLPLPTGDRPQRQREMPAKFQDFVLTE